MHDAAQPTERRGAVEGRAALLRAGHRGGGAARLDRGRLVLRLLEAAGQQHAQLTELLPRDEAVLVLVHVLDRRVDELAGAAGQVDRHCVVLRQLMHELSEDLHRQALHHRTQRHRSDNTQPSENCPLQVVVAHLPLGVVQVMLGEDIVCDVEGLVPCVLELAGAQVEPALVVAVDRGQHDVHHEEQALRPDTPPVAGGLQDCHRLPALCDRDGMAAWRPIQQQGSVFRP